VLVEALVAELPVAKLSTYAFSTGFPGLMKWILTLGLIDRSQKHGRSDMKEGRPKLLSLFFEL